MSRIAFTVWRERVGGSPDLFLVELPDGTPRLLASDLDISQFALSPDEQRVACIVWSRNRKQQGQLWLIEADGSGRRSLLLPSLVRGLAWSPDGERLAVLVEQTWQYELLVAQADGSSVQRVASGSIDVAWSPDGTRLAVLSFDGDYGLSVMNADGSNARQVLDDQPLLSQPTWTPDGEQMLFVGALAADEGGMGLFAIRPDGTDLRRLTSLNFCIDFTFAPDGKQIAYIGLASPDDEENGAVCVMDVDGRNPRSIVTPVDWDDWLGPETPRWLPDGEHLVFVAVNEKDENHLYTIKVDGTDRRCLTEAWDMSDAVLRLGWLNHTQMGTRYQPRRSQPPPAGQSRLPSWLASWEGRLRIGLLLLAGILLESLMQLGFKLERPEVYLLCAALLLLSLLLFYLLWRSPPANNTSLGWFFWGPYAFVLPLFAIWLSIYDLVVEPLPAYGLMGFLGFVIQMVGSFGLWIGLLMMEGGILAARRKHLQGEHQPPVSPPKETDPFIKDEEPEED